MSSTDGVIQTALTSSIIGLGSSAYISSFDLVSSIEGLGTAGYISSLSNVSLISSLNADFGFINATRINVDSIYASTICTYTQVVYGVSTLIVQGLLYTSTLYLPDSKDTLYYPLTVSSGALAINNVILASSNETSKNLQSSIQGLGTCGYISSSLLLDDITSTIVGLGTDLYISSANLQSSITGLGSTGYISSFNLTSTIQGLGSIGYLSTSPAYDLSTPINGPGDIQYCENIGGSIQNTIIYFKFQ